MRMVRKKVKNPGPMNQDFQGKINNYLSKKWGGAGGRILNGKKEPGKGYKGQKGFRKHLKLIFVNQP